uniref:Vacuolar protein sorting-associated protein 18 homolog n=1 Tax=Plectus sambesii TaxID=2011161 RepID=A0A914V2Z5_9BILA
SDSTLFYKFSPALIDAIPDKLVDAWIAQGPKLQPKRLLPALFRCVKEQVKVDAAIRFLEHCLVKHEKDQAIHNFLISLYARHRPEKLLDYLLIQGSDRNTICYDVKFALRVCSEKGLDRACVHLYSVSELHEEAITLALKLNVNLAKQYAKLLMQNNFDDRGSSIITDPHELRKKIWLKIARHVVEKEQDIAACMELMTESNGILKIQDLLPFFPEFATIEHFKESLCACLKEHSGKIQELQKEMKEATDVATDIRTDMAKLKNKYTIVRVQDKCGLCADAVMARPFYAFPCRHFFHTDCLEKEIGAFLPNESIEKLASLKRQLLTVQTTAGGAQPNTIGVGSNGDSRTNEQERQIRVKIDDILATECPWCGQLMINSVNKPFYTLAQYGSELKTWDVR